MNWNNAPGSKYVLSWNFLINRMARSFCSTFLFFLAVILVLWISDNKTKHHNLWDLQMVVWLNCQVANQSLLIITQCRKSNEFLLGTRNNHSATGNKTPPPVIWNWNFFCPRIRLYANLSEANSRRRDAVHTGATRLFSELPKLSYNENRTKWG